MIKGCKSTSLVVIKPRMTASPLVAPRHRDPVAFAAGSEQLAASASQAARAASRGDRAARSNSAHRPAGGFPAGGLVAARRRESIDPAMIWRDSPTSAAPRTAGGLKPGGPAQLGLDVAQRHAGGVPGKGEPCIRRRQEQAPAAQARELRRDGLDIVARRHAVCALPYRGGLTANLAGACPSAMAAS